VRIEPAGSRKEVLAFVRAGLADFSVSRPAARADLDLANGVGNLVNRTLHLTHRYRDGRVPAAAPQGAAGHLLAAGAALPGRIDHALARFDYRAATQALRALVEDGNRLVETERPWQLARAEDAGGARAAARLDGGA